MMRVNIHDAKTHLSEYLARLKDDETITLCRRNVPVAEIRLVSQRPPKKRPIGLYKGKLKISKAFFEPLPEEVLEEFDGRFGR